MSRKILWILLEAAPFVLTAVMAGWASAHGNLMACLIFTVVAFCLFEGLQQNWLAGWAGSTKAAKPNNQDEEQSRRRR